MLRRISFLAVLLIPVLASAQLAISPRDLPDPVIGALYHQELRATNATVPVAWKVSGRLPPGITFDVPTGKLSGVCSTAGDYRFTVTLSDAARGSVSRQYVLHVGDGLTISLIWTSFPAISNGRISGEVEVSNSGREAFDLTFIAVAVDEIGRATALGYQRFSLRPGTQRIPFASSVPHGTYSVHADVVGEIARTLTIRRARLQTPPLPVP